MATLLKYKKGLKRPTLAWNEMSFVTHTQKDNGGAEGPMYYSKHIFTVYGQYSVVLFSIRKHNGMDDNM